MAVRAKVFHYAAAVDRLGQPSAEDGAPLALGDEWQPEHLLLAGLLRCTITSLRHHAGRAGAELLASGTASGTITKRESDGRYAFAEIECALDVVLKPLPEDVPGLLAKAERDCFVGASLAVAPSYRWTVNGTVALPA